MGSVSACRSATRMRAEGKRYGVSAARQKLNWAILGTGKIAHIFAEALPYSATGRLAAAGSRSAESASIFARTHGADRWHEGYEAALSDPSVDAVYIATPHTTHLELILGAARYGKHILCEKPLTVTAEQAQEAADAARRAGSTLMEGFAFRYHSQTRLMLSLVRDGAIGRVRAIDASFGYDAGPSRENYLLRRDLAGGSILDVGCYPVAMARLIAGATEGQPFAEPSRVLGAALISEADGVDLRARATLEFGTGVIADLSSSIVCGLANAVTVWGSRGVLSLNQPWLPGASRPGEIQLQTRDGRHEAYPSTGENLYAAEADELARCAALGESPFMRIADSLGNMRVLDAWRIATGLRFDADDAAPILETHEEPLASLLPPTTNGIEP